MGSLRVPAQLGCKLAPDHLCMNVGKLWGLNFRRKKEKKKLTQTPHEKYYFCDCTSTDFGKLKN